MLLFYNFLDKKCPLHEYKNSPFKKTLLIWKPFHSNNYFDCSLLGLFFIHYSHLRWTNQKQNMLLFEIISYQCL